MRMLILLAAAICSPPAHAMNGLIEVKSGSLRVEREDGMKVNFYPGSYHSQLEIDGNKVHLMIDRKDVRTDATVVIPAGTAIPENGAVDIDGFRTGQTFALKGTIATGKENSPTYKGTESCTIDRESWVCGGYGSDYSCKWVSYPAPGTRAVEYYFETRTVTLALALDSHNGGQASFNGKDMNRRKFYSAQGNCY